MYELSAAFNPIDAIIAPSVSLSMSNWIVGINHSVDRFQETLLSMSTQEQLDQAVTLVDMDKPSVINSFLDVTIRLGDSFLSAAGNFINGTVMGGVGYHVSMPSFILNGDGYENVAMAGIVADFYRPGNNELSMMNFNDEIQRFRMTGIIAGPEDFTYLVNFHSGSINARSLLNIDPLVLDLNGDGVNLIAFADSKVLFDVDADGYKEATAWASAQDGILVWDKNANGQVDDITETISEYFTDGVKDGLEALPKAHVSPSSPHDFGGDPELFFVWIPARTMPG